MESTEISFYKVLVLLISALSIAFGIVNIVYFNKIRLNDNCKEISSGAATNLIWINIILVVLGSSVFFWSLFRLIFTGEEKETVKQTINTHVHDYGYTQDSPTPKSVTTKSLYSPTTITTY